MTATFEFESTYGRRPEPQHPVDEIVTRLALIKPPGKGDSGMAEEQAV